MWENIVKPDRLQMTIRCMRIACWIPKNTNTHTQFVQHALFSTATMAARAASVLRYKYIACLVCFICETEVEFLSRRLHFFLLVRHFTHWQGHLHGKLRITWAVLIKLRNRFCVLSSYNCVSCYFKNSIREVRVVCRSVMIVHYIFYRTACSIQ
jgi:hypothetical protein